jgi:thymidylate synthase (FAD)
MKVRLVSYSQPSQELLEHNIDDIQDLIAFCARVSNPANQYNTETSEKLLNYLMKHKHWSVFEMANVCLEIETTRDIARQILRHRSMNFQEFCLSGDTDIYFAIPTKIKEGKYEPKRKYKLSDLYDKWVNGSKPIFGRTTNKEIRMPMKTRIQEMLIKCYDEDEKKLTVSTIKDIFYTGKKDVYKITLSDGKEIKCTKEHKFLTKDGFFPLEDIVGLKLIKNDNRTIVSMTKKDKIAVNGIINYQDKDWCIQIKNESLFEKGGYKYISEKYDIPDGTLRTWFKKHGITYSPQETQIILGNNGNITNVNPEETYKNKDWMTEKKKESLFKKGGLKYLSEKYSINYNTLRKWLKIHNISYTREEHTIIVGDIWNKGIFGYKNKPHSEETRLKMRESARKGSESNLWRGGGSKNGVRKTFDTVRALTYKREKNFKCERCSSSYRLNIHHKIPVSVEPTKINDIDNWELLCINCHIEHHKKEDHTGWQAMAVKARTNNSYIPKWVDIKYIEFMGEEDTYDIEVNHKSHNYVANGIIVHNSQRYGNAIENMDFVLREARLQDHKNRQNSISVEDEQLQREWDEKQQGVINKAKEAYEWAIEKGIAKEQARAVLPEGNTMSRMYVNGTLRSWVHYCELRCGNGTQKEHMEVAKACAEVISKIFPTMKKIN